MEQSNKKRVGIYIRVSTLDQAKKGTSLEDQEESLKLYIQANSIDKWELAENGVYRDDGISGFKGIADRPEFDRLMNDVNDKRLDIVLVYRIDRLARNTELLLNTVKKFKTKWVQFVSMSDRIDTDTASGKMLLAILGAMAEMERNLIYERTYAWKIRKLSMGYASWWWFDLPLGYKKWEDGKIMIDEPYKELIQEIFDLCTGEKHFTPKEIAAELSSREETTWWDKKMEKLEKKQVKKGVWNADTVRKILLNPIYKWVYYFWKTRKVLAENEEDEITVKVPEEEWLPVPMPCGWIITEKQWEDAKYQIQKINKINRGRWRSHIFTGLIKCWFDWMSYICYRSERNKIEHFYYRCGGTNASKNENKRKDTDVGNIDMPLCNNLQVPELELYNYCIDVITRFIEEPEALYKEKIGNDEEFQKQKKILETKIEEDKWKIKELEDMITSLYYQKYKDKTNADNIQNVLDTYTQDKEAVLKRLENNEKDLLNSENLLNSGKQMKQFAETYKDKLANLTEEQGTELIRLLVDRIEVKGTLITVFFKFKPNPESFTHSETLKKNSKKIEGGDFTTSSTPNKQSLQKIIKSLQKEEIFC